MRRGKATGKIWMGRLLICIILAFAGVWGEVVIAGALNRTPEVTYKVKVHHIEHTGEKDCRIVPVVKKTGDPKLIYTDFDACETIKKGDYIRLPDPGKYPSDIER